MLWHYFGSACFFLAELIENIKPVNVYHNLKEKRSLLFKENKNKPGIYCIVNISNGHNYIGSSINLANRMRNYLKISFLNKKRNINMPIVNALLKYGSYNFVVLIIEYTDLDVIIIRETHLITKIQPYYNVFKQGVFICML